MWLLQKLFSAKGTYINFNPPVELYPREVRYVDLEVDACVMPDGMVKVVDEEKLWKAVEKGFISRELASFVMDKVNEVVKNLSSRSKDYKSP